MELKKIIYVDFDGVINSYQTKFDQNDPFNIPDPPVHGAIEWLCELVRKYHVVIYSCRLLHPDGEAALHHWFFANKMPNHLIDQLAFSHTKRGAHLYIDDRAFRFEGVFPTPEKIDSFIPWGKQ